MQGGFKDSLGFKLEQYTFGKKGMDFNKRKMGFVFEIGSSTSREVPEI